LTIREIEAKSILRKHKKIDSWFISRYGINLYRGCTHNCVYCDGRSETYYVDGEFGRDVTVKVNAIELLRRELDPKRKRVPFKRSFIVMGGGVGDSYQPLERKYELTRKALELMYEYNLPVHMLTKSTLIKRDIDILKKISEQSRAVVSFSFSSVDDKISAVFEPGVPPPDERLNTISFFKNDGIACGMFLLPVIAGADCKQSQRSWCGLRHLRRHDAERGQAAGLLLRCVEENPSRAYCRVSKYIQGKRVGGSHQGVLQLDKSKV
jgi:DNA repair photolyase